MVIPSPFEVNNSLNPGSYIHNYKNGLFRFPSEVLLGEGRGQTGERKAFKPGCFHEPRRCYNGSSYYPISSLHSTFYQNKITVEI